MFSKVAILGAGRLGQALVRGLQAAEFRPALAVTGRTSSSIGGVSVAGIDRDPHATRDAVRDADAILVAVRPTQVEKLVLQIAPAVAPGAVVVPLAIGVTSRRLHDLLPPRVEVVRAMPNTPVAVRRGMTGISAELATDRGAVDDVRALFELVGDVVEVTEGELDRFSTVAGAGPAYVSYFIATMTEASESLQLSLTREQQGAIVQQTFDGTLALLKVDGQRPQELLDEVASPGGATEQAMIQLRRGNLRGVLARAMHAAADRADEVSLEIGR